MSVTHNLNIYKKNELIRGDIDESEENCDEVKSKVGVFIFVNIFL